MWYYKNKEYKEIDSEDLIGFVYRITDLKNNRFYIGKKLFHFSKTKQVKKKKKKFKVESDWKTYYGSNDELKAVIAELGTENFKREIIRLCKSKGECSYYETKMIFELDALLKKEYYNSWVSCKIQRNHLLKLQV